MWIPKWFLKIQSKRAIDNKLHEAQAVFTAADPSKPERKICEELLLQLSIPQFALYHTEAGQTTTIEPLYKNIEDYITKLKEVTKIVRAGHILMPDKSANFDGEISVDRFLTSSDGYHIDIEKAVERFKKAGLDFCKSMEASDTEDAGDFEYNLRVLTKLFINLRIVTGTLIEVSLQN